jgi:glutathione peroxidase-family protein
MQYSNKEISQSRLEAVAKIIEILDAAPTGEIDALFNDRGSSYYSKDKSIVSFKTNKFKVAAARTVDKTSTGAEYCIRAFLHEEVVIKSFKTIEQALLYVLIELSKSLHEHAETIRLFEKYVVPYNKQITRRFDTMTEL